MNEKTILKKIVSLCYEEEIVELNKELASIEVEVKKEKDYTKAIEEIYEIVLIYASEELSQETFNEIENLYEEFLDF